MIIPDLNLLLYAHNSDASFHLKAKEWWEECLNGEELVGLPQVVVFGFLRVATNLRAYEKPMTPTEAANQVRSWLSVPVVELVETDSRPIQ